MTIYNIILSTTTRQTAQPWADCAQRSVQTMGLLNLD